MNKALSLIFLFIALGFFIPSCTYDKAEELIKTPLPPDTISFNKSVKRIIELRCYVGQNSDNCCHESSNLCDRDFTTFQGFNIYSGDKIKSAINQTSGSTPMPFNNPKIPQAEIDTIEAWINQGRLNN